MLNDLIWNPVAAPARILDAFGSLGGGHEWASAAALYCSSALP
jgi:hypothetical protein